MKDVLESRRIIGMRVDATSYSDATDRITEWAKSGESKYVCVAAVNNVMEAHDAASFMAVMNGADLVTPDGMPLVWGLKKLGVSNASRVYGPDLTPVVLERAAREGIRIGLYGGTEEMLRTFCERAEQRWPGLQIVYRNAPPFRSLSEDELQSVVEEVNASGVQVLLVGLGCPKQEVWMARNKGRIEAVMVGVGAAFDFFAGAKKQAPAAMQRTGTEWLFRLATEPKRLWRRYLRHNPRFVALFGRQLLRERGNSGDNLVSQSNRRTELP